MKAPPGFAARSISRLSEESLADKPGVLPQKYNETHLPTGKY
jgi:hypothetical protein